MAGPNFTTAVTIDPGSGFTGRILDMLINSASKAWVDQDGNVFIGGKVGIGTTPSTTALEVSGDNNNAATLVAKNTATSGNNAAQLTLAAHNGSAVVGLGYLAASNSTYSYQDYGANAAWLGSAGAGGLGLFAQYTSGKLRFYTGGDAASNLRMIIDASGNVGIGTASPSASFHVANNARFDGKVGIGTAPQTYGLHVVGANNDASQAVIANSVATGNNAAQLSLFSHNGSLVAQVGYLAASNNTFSYQDYGANATWLGSSGSGGLGLFAQYTSGKLRFYTGGDAASNLGTNIFDSEDGAS